MADDDRIARALAGVTNVLRMPSRVARSMVEGFDDLVERAKTESTSAALGGDFNPQPGMELATGAIGGGTPFAVRGALGAAGGKLVQPPGIRAYHGSPYDFERFDMSKIGTGEGAQAYGHGLYFAENPGTAQSYRDALTKSINLQKPDYRRAQDWLDQWPSREEARRGIDEYAAIFRKRGDDYLAREYEAMIPHLDNPYKGKMYEVNIRAEPQQFLDWDKPLAGQPAGAQNLFEALPHRQSHQVYMDYLKTKGEELPGSGLYRMIQETGKPDQATAALREAGIPGIRYLDQGSRAKPDISSIQRVGDQFVAFDKYGAEMQRFKTLEEAKAFRDPTQTSNYVLFRDDIIDILRKYGIAVPPTGAALANQNRVADALAGEQQ